MKYFKPSLRRSGTWVAVLLAMLLVATACSDAAVDTPGGNSDVGAPLTEEGLKNGTYELEELGAIQLSDGEYKNQWGAGATQVDLAGLEMAGQIAAYPEATTAMAFNLVSSHDTDRLLVEVGGWEAGDAPGPEILARYRLTSAVLFALPGMPVTFQGDECGAMGGSRDRLATRYPIQWEACDPESVGHYARLAELKRTVPALGSPVFRSYAEATPVLAFLRGEPGPGEVLAVFNNATSAAVVPLPEGTWTDLVSGEDFADSASVDGLGWRYLRRQ